MCNDMNKSEMGCKIKYIIPSRIQRFQDSHTQSSLFFYIRISRLEVKYADLLNELVVKMFYYVVAQRCMCFTENQRSSIMIFL